MSHIMVRKYQTKEGLKWTATQATWDNAKNGSVEKKLEPFALESLGFSVHMTPDQARAHAKKLNALNAITRKEQASQVKAAERLTDLITVENSIIPSELSAAFIQYMEQNWYGGAYNLRKQVQHWNLVQKMLTKLKIQPHEYFKRQKDFYKYFEKNQMSKSYVEKVLKVVNLWGEFYSEQSKSYFKRVPNPKGIVLESIVDASEADGNGADPLDIDTLPKLKALPPGQFEYMRATLWLGLRPSDLDGLLENPSYIKTRLQGKTTVASIYQPKLTSVPKAKRWKHVPLFHKDMVQALADIQAGVPKKPLVKSLRKAVPSMKKIGLYSGRKGFTDLMLSLGQSLENASMWIGHVSIERTWKHYKNKEIVEFNEIEIPKPKKLKVAK